MADPFLAEIRIFPFNFAPRGWAHCDGQLMPLAQNTALFALLGTTYGGDGRSTFALPNLQGRTPMQPGQGPGLSYRDLGESGGSDTITLREDDMPRHNHSYMASDAARRNSSSPAGKQLARSSGFSAYKDAPALTTRLAAQALSPAGDSAPHNNMQPYLTAYFCIALQGVFPPRS